MPRRINDKCIGCEWCIPQCPVDCISWNHEGLKVEINENICIDCGACQQVCPVSAIDEVLKNLKGDKKKDEEITINIFVEG